MTSIGAAGGTLPPAPPVSWIRYCDIVNERNELQRRLNRLDAAVSHHKRETDKLFADVHDEALYAARDRIIAPA